MIQNGAKRPALTLDTYPSSSVPDLRADDPLYVAAHALLNLGQDIRHAPLLTVQCQLSRENKHGQHGAPGKISMSCGCKVLIQNGNEGRAGRSVRHVLENTWPAAKEDGEASEQLISSVTQGGRGTGWCWTHWDAWFGRHIVDIVICHQVGLTHQWIRTVEASANHSFIWQSHGLKLQQSAVSKLCLSLVPTHFRCLGHIPCHVIGNLHSVIAVPGLWG